MSSPKKTPVRSTKKAAPRKRSQKKQRQPDTGLPLSLVGMIGFLCLMLGIGIGPFLYKAVTGERTYADTLEQGRLPVPSPPWVSPYPPSSGGRADELDREIDRLLKDLEKDPAPNPAPKHGNKPWDPFNQRRDRDQPVEM